MPIPNPSPNPSPSATPSPNPSPSPSPTPSQVDNLVCAMHEADGPAVGGYATSLIKVRARAGLRVNGYATSLIKVLTKLHELTLALALTPTL